MNIAGSLSDVLVGTTGTTVSRGFQTTLPFPPAGQKRKRADVLSPLLPEHNGDRVTDVGQKVNEPRKAYIMTNRKGGWVANLISAEQKPTLQALDMFVVQRREAFIGNGVRFPFGSFSRVFGRN
jgi:hypothetical protein